MLHKIYKGWHRAFPPLLPWLCWKKDFNWKVKFNRSAIYSLGDDRTDINKLCGIGYFPSHHKDSARFGWRYNWQNDKIDLFAYCYVDGVSNHLPDKEVFLCSVGFDEPHLLQLRIYPSAYGFAVDDEMKSVVNKTHQKKFGYRLGLYFGGNQPAPHNITIDLKKV